MRPFITFWSASLPGRKACSLRVTASRRSCILICTTCMNTSTKMEKSHVAVVFALAFVFLLVYACVWVRELPVSAFCLPFLAARLQSFSSHVVAFNKLLLLQSPYSFLISLMSGGRTQIIWPECWTPGGVGGGTRGTR